MFRVERILCPIDLSEASRHALDHAVVLARWYSAPVTVLHVHTPVYLAEPTPAIVGVTTQNVFDQADADRLRGEIREFVRAAAPGAVCVDVVVDDGPAAARILEHARASRADVIVMGTHGLSGFEHFMVGSVTEKVLRKANCPVLTVPPRAQATSHLPFKRLLCPVDFSDASLAAVRVAFEIARESDAHISLLYVLDGSNPDPGAALQALVPPDAREWCDPTTLVASGKPDQEILRFAELDSADLIVTGVSGRNPIDMMLFGSTTNHVVRQARCPVLTVMAPGGQRPREEPREKAQLIAMAP
jgi:nucleotide-binding universal stress UspA family protein